MLGDGKCPWYCGSVLRMLGRELGPATPELSLVRAVWYLPYLFPHLAELTSSDIGSPSAPSETGVLPLV